MVGVWTLHPGADPEYLGGMTNALALEFVRSWYGFRFGKGIRFTPPHQWTAEPFGDFYDRDQAVEWLSTRIARAVAAGLRPAGLPRDW